MMENSKIEWTRHTFSPWWGCSPVSESCEHCYAAALAKRYGWACFGESPRRTFGAKHWADPLKWDVKAKAAGGRHRVFCGSMCDVFEEGPLESERAKLWDLIDATPNLDWLLLTKRPENIITMVPGGWYGSRPLAHAPLNVRLGVTAENQQRWDERWPRLREVANTLFASTFISCEPLLGPIQIIDDEDKRKPDWVIVGRETGPGARDFYDNWARALRDQCMAAGVPFFLKKTADGGSMLDGREWREFPQIGGAR